MLFMTASVATTAKAHLPRPIVVILILPVILIIAAVAYFRINEHILGNKIRHELLPARQKAIASAEQKLSRQLAVLNELNLINKQIASSKMDNCQLNHQDSGWLMINWYQGCTIRYILGYETSFNKTQTLQALSDNTKITSIFGKLPGTYELTDEPCKIAGQDFDFGTLRLRAVNDPSFNTNALGCAIPGQVDDSGESDIHQLHYEDTYFNAYRSFNNSNIKSTSNELWLIYEAAYYRRDLGCSGLLCNSPLRHPVLAPPSR
jgi:hypothetical protein